jgi:uncharacterized membrane protein YphA (DoxX/SURF4 family)
MGEERAGDGTEEAVRKIIDNDWLTLLSRILIAAMFLYAAYYKVIHPADFAKSIWYYHMVPGSLINLMALILAWLEVVIALALLSGFWFRGAAAWSTLLLVVFIIALGVTIAKGINIDCGCFQAGGKGSHSAADALWRDLVAILFSVQMMFSKSRRWMIGAR